jgi:hypothetical protein
MEPSITKLLARKEVKYLMLFIIGFGLATIMRDRCDGVLCRKHVAPDMQEVERGEWRLGVACHKVKFEPVPCPVSGTPIISSY